MTDDECRLTHRSQRDGQTRNPSVRCNEHCNVRVGTVTVHGPIVIPVSPSVLFPRFGSFGFVLDGGL
ncbi:hypothetical protein EVAR_7868_1 [Eumeta japonica]|uniref:Uncharacterized protein n=1 Tax=Eumeta variegata TaxID=151549 RepID=A0A4C1TV25_EUMVA|nr:hypothetical protein EVAR_7868_1 [Eumeta japonica]